MIIVLLTSNNSKACTPCAQLSNLSTTIIGSNLLLTFTSNAGWSCCYNVNVEIVCANANFTGSGAFNSVQLCLTSGAVTNVPYQNLTIPIGNLCPGNYKWRGQEMGCNLFTPPQFFTITGGSPIIATATTASANICPGQSTALSASGVGGCNGLGNYIYSWAPTTGLSNANTANPGASPLVTTTYTVTLTEAGSCAPPQTASVTVNVTPLPTGTITGAIAVCRDAPEPIVTFTGASSNAPYVFTYNINGGANQTVTSIGNVATVTAPTNVSGSFSYTLISVLESSPQACSQLQLATTIITIIPPLESTIVGDANVCLNGPEPIITFTGSGGVAPYTFTYNIDGGPDQTVVSTGAGNTATINASTATLGTSDYNLLFVQATGPTSCEADQTGTVQITINELPVAVISPMVEVCRNDAQPTVTFTGSNGAAPFEFTYTINGGAPNTVLTAPGDISVNVLSPTNVVDTFDHVITNINMPNAVGCTQVQNVTGAIVVHPLPTVIAGNDISPCLGATVILYGSGAGFGANYSWDNGIFDLVGFVPGDTTTYTVTGTDIFGCVNTDQVTVNVAPFPVITFDGNNLYGCQPLVSTFDNLSTGNITSCQWSFSNGVTLDTCGTVEVTFNDPGCWDATLTAISPEGCVSTRTLLNYACVEPNPIANFFPDPPNLTIYDSESQMLNSSTGATSFVWDFGDGSETSTENSPFHIFPNEGEGAFWVQLIATSDVGCVDTVRRAVIVIEDVVFYVPNTFTPNGDPLNSEFKPVVNAGVDLQSYSLYIYNRWGEIVFESHDSNIGWKGYYGSNGNEAKSGTYNWKIDFKRRMNGELLKYTGYVNLLR